MRMQFDRSQIAPTILFALTGASIISISIADFFEIDVTIFPYVFFLAATGCAFLFQAARFDLPRLRLTDHLFAIGIAMILMLPRVPYIIELFLGHTVQAACWDDWWHIQEVSSIVHSQHFPPQSTFKAGYFLSFYFAPWAFGSALYSMELITTAKQALFCSVAFLSMLFGYTLIYAGSILFGRGSARAYVLIASVLLFGGADFFYGLYLATVKYFEIGHLVFSHAEWWAAPFGFRVQFSNFFTLALWVPHHLASAVTALFAIYVFSRPMTVRTSVCAGIALAFSGFSSVFAVIGSVPLLIWIVAKQRPPIRNLFLVVITTIGLATPLIWMYVGRTHGGFSLFGELSPFWEKHKIYGFFAYVGVLCAEFLPIFLAVWLGREQSRRHRMVIYMSLSFLLSTYFIAYSGANNYALRGAIVPVFSLIYVAVPGLERMALKWGGARFLLVPFFLGSLWELLSFGLSAWGGLNHATQFRIDAFENNVRRGGTVSQELLLESEEDRYGWYVLENFKPDDKAELIGADLELINADNKYRVTFQGLLSAVSK